jgi:hypothetical protein
MRRAALLDVRARLVIGQVNRWPVVLIKVFASRTFDGCSSKKTISRA